ncbi:MAG: hypothetical protein J5840_07080 [Lachnospiraceae bacterium]|nr:hypothetical protein [Lachnospiraceae bacterium]
MKKFLTGAISVALVISLAACVPTIGSNDGGKDFNSGNADVDPVAVKPSSGDEGGSTGSGDIDVDLPVNPDKVNAEEDKYSDYPSYYIYDDKLYTQNYTDPDGVEQESAYVTLSVVDMYSGEYNDYKYAELSKALEEYNKERQEGAKVEFDGLVDMFDEMVEESDGAWMPTIYSVHHAGVIRADQKVFSIMQNTEAYNGGVHGENFLSGVCFDSQTGEKIEFEDVVIKTDDLTDIVVDELYENYEKDRFFDQTEEALKETVASFMQDEPLWVLTYDGVMIFFGDYTLSAYAFGPESVFINYKEYPDHLNPEYFENVDTEYVMHAAHDVLYPVTSSDGKQSAMGFDWAREYIAEGDFWSETYQHFYVYGGNYQEIDLDGSIIDPSVYIIRKNGREYVYIQNYFYDGVGWLQTYEIKDGNLEFLEAYGVSIDFSTNELTQAMASASVGFTDDMVFAETPVNVADDGYLDWPDDRWFYYLNLDDVKSGEAFDNDYYVTNTDINAHSSDEDGRANTDSVTIKSGTKIVPYCTDGYSYVTVIAESGDWYTIDITIKDGYAFAIDDKYARNLIDYVYNW